MARTPGPWTMHPEGIPYVNCGESGPSFGPVVMAGSIDEMLADARLIAVAPEMLAALRDVAEYLGDPPPAPLYPSKQYAIVCALIRTVRAAIEKADAP